MTSGRHTTSNTSWNNVVYVKFEIYSIEQRRTNVVCLKVDLNNVRQGRNKFAIFTVNFHNVGQRWNNVAKRQFEKKNNSNKQFSSQKKNNIFKLRIKIILIEYAGLNIFFILFPIFREIYKIIFAEPQKFLKHCGYTKLLKPSLDHFTLQNVNWFLTS